MSELPFAEKKDQRKAIQALDVIKIDGRLAQTNSNEPEKNGKPMSGEVNNVSIRFLDTGESATIYPDEYIVVPRQNIFVRDIQISTEELDKIHYASGEPNYFKKNVVYYGELTKK